MANMNGNDASDHEPIYPTHLGYYVKQGLNTTHSELPRGYCKLDKDLINEINHKDVPTSFDGEFDDFGIDHNNNPILQNTVVLESYVNAKKPRTNNKLRIFARGGPLCSFFAGNELNIPSVTLDFEYDEKKNTLCFVDSTTSAINRTAHAFTVIGRHRLTGDDSRKVYFGEDNIYKVMELITDDYELYYSKEIDGFDGNQPIEIRGVRYDWGLQSRKMYYKSVVMADVKKIVVMISNDEQHVYRVSIVNDFTVTCGYLGDGRKAFFKKMNSFFTDYIRILKKFKKGKITRAHGGMIIEPHSALPAKEKEGFCVVSDSNTQQIPSNLKALVFLKYPQNAGHLYTLIENLGADAILGCFLQNWKIHREGKKEHCYAAQHYWRKVVTSLNPGVLWPCDLIPEDICAVVPFYYRIPFMPAIIIFNDESWGLSQNNNILVGQRKEDIEKLLGYLAWPVVEFSGRIQMTVYTQCALEECKDLLKSFFGNLITFEGPDPTENIIFCRIPPVPGADFQDAVYRALPVPMKNHPSPYRDADLYLIGNGGYIKGRWSNSNDLQLLKNFKHLDPVRKHPETVALFSIDNNEANRVTKLLKDTHKRAPNTRNPILFNAKAVQ